MERAGAAARCPACGASAGPFSPVRVFAVTGVAGCTAAPVVEPLAQRLAGHCVTFGADWLDAALDGAAPAPARPPGRARGSAADPDGAALCASRRFEAWLTVAHGAAQSGLATVLVGWLPPELLERAAARSWIDELHFLLLDCPDEVLRGRTGALPAWRRGEPDAESAAAARLRDGVADRLDTSQNDPEAVVSAIATWVLDRIPGGSQPAAGLWERRPGYRRARRTT